MDLQLSDMFFGNRTSAWMHRRSKKNDNYIANDEYAHHQLSRCGRDSCYGVKLNGDAVEQSHSKVIHCSDTFRLLKGLRQSQKLSYNPTVGFDP